MLRCAATNDNTSGCNMKPDVSQRNGWPSNLFCGNAPALTYLRTPKVASMTCKPPRLGCCPTWSESAGSVGHFQDARAFFLYAAHSICACRSASLHTSARRSADLG